MANTTTANGTVVPITNPLLQGYGLTVEARFIPSNEPRDFLLWNVTLKQDGREIVSHEYRAGAAHAPSYSNPPRFATGSRDGKGNIDKHTHRLLIQAECMTGKPHRSFHVGSSAITPLHGKPPIMPDAEGVIYSFALDTEVGEHTFENFADEFGYDRDSRKAYAIWLECVDIRARWATMRHAEQIKINARATDDPESYNYYAVDPQGNSRKIEGDYKADSFATMDAETKDRGWRIEARENWKDEAGQ